ncbi:hypothetical protein AURDEDRAFT_135910 [Auricularia subglabra TFB-10046 SS5]|nr:hypothetical protein AURDEDRAFT_135910 [Auricularia subglabra TFB-10046 SS5]
MDARSLLRQKREAARVEHPYASYASGSLRCTVCGVAVKDGGGWDGHLGSKAHRKNLARVREEQKAQELQQQQQRKRPAPEEAQDEPERVDKKRRVEPPSQPNAGGRFPVDFFSDPSRALATNDNDEDEEGEAEPVPEPAQAQEKSQLDLEWEAFQASVVNANLAAEAQDDMLARATVFAAPELIEELPQGFPAELAERRRAAQAALEPAEAPQIEEKKKETTAERARRRAEEEKEEIMSRILEEERLQEEADNKVAQLKARLELIKRQRAAKQKAK